MGHKDQTKIFEETFEKHSDELFRHCLMRLSDRERALEITQEAFLRTWECIARGDEIHQHRSFLYRVLNNLIVDEYRKKHSQSLDALLENEETSSFVEAELLRDDTDEFEEAITRFDTSYALEALQNLSEPYKTVVILRYIDGLSLSEIASCISESENTVSVRIHRGLKKLRDSISPQIKDH